MKTSKLFNLDFANENILSCFFFLIIDSYFLMPEVIAHNFNLNTELVISIGIPTEEAKAEMETHPVILEINKSKCSK